MSRHDPVLIGFFPKKTAHPDQWFRNTCVEEICSVSTCISLGPEDWINRWKHNTTWWLFDTDLAAYEVIKEDPSSYEIYAYRIFPVVFDGPMVSSITMESSATGDLSEYEFLGYDPVSREIGSLEFGHSPLSCNAGFEKYNVNRFCLVNDLDEAWRITSEIARDATEHHTWEPGPYYLCEVNRKRKLQSTE